MGGGEAMRRSVEGAERAPEAGIASRTRISP